MLTLFGRAKGQTVGKEDEESRPARPKDQLGTETVQDVPAKTLLYQPLASGISTVTGITSLNLRLATKIGGWTIYATREGTLKSLSVARSAAEQVLILAGRDVASRTTPDSIGQQEAANTLQSTIHFLHSAISQTSFIASSGFYLTEALINQSSGAIIHGLSVFNALFGNTETSKAVAAVITLLSTELNKPHGEHVVRYLDLVLGLCGFVLLQRWGRRKTQLDFRNDGGEQTIWDTVIDDRGFRADVVGTRRQETITLRPGTQQHTHSFVSPAADDNPEATFEALERGTLFDSTHTMELSAEDQTRLSDQELRDQITRQLPPGARAVVKTETFTAKTIKVEIYDADATDLQAPPGTIMVAERLNHDTIDNDQSPRQTVVFRTALQRSSSADIEPEDILRLTAPEEEESDQEDTIMMRDVAKTSAPSGEDPPRKRILKNKKPTIEHNHASSEPPNRDSVANQKKIRKPAFNLLNSAESTSAAKASSSKSGKGKAPSDKQDKEGKIRKAMKSLSPTSSFAAIRDAPSLLPRKRSSEAKQLPGLSRLTSISPEPALPRLYPPIPSTSNGPSPFGSPGQVASPISTTANNYFVRETRRDSVVSHTDTYSVHSVDSRPGSRASSPTFSRTHSRTVNSMSQTQSELGLSMKGTDGQSTSQSTAHHQRTRSFQPSLYSMGSKHSGEAVVLAPRMPQPRKSIYEDSDMVDALIRDGKVPGTFPDQHLVRTVRRFARFATASYGERFLHVMGYHNIGENLSKGSELVALGIHREHSSFSDHTGLPADTILLSSFFDPHGVEANPDWSSAGSAVISPLIHFVSLDHESKTVVLSIRGTLGFEDILTDMTCDYDELAWEGQNYKVHKGIHASARRLLGGGSSRVVLAIKSALEDHPEYGLVLCGHSLGGAVAALLAILIAEPSATPNGQSFVTRSPQKLLTGSTQPESHSHPPVSLPSGRPIHVYSYGTPATVSESLRLATRGLITTVANAADIVPCLSLGTLHDFRAIAVQLKHDKSDAIAKLKSRVWSRITTAFSISMTAEKSPGGPPPPDYIAGEGVGEDTWAWKLLLELRGVMNNEKLVPPGEVFIVESTRVFDRLGADVKQEARFGFGAEGEASKDNATEDMYRALGRPATRVQFKWVKDVKGRFAEIRFGSGMFADHSPGRYERNLGSLESGVCDE